MKGQVAATGNLVMGSDSEITLPLSNKAVSMVIFRLPRETRVSGLLILALLDLDRLLSWGRQTAGHTWSLDPSPLSINGSSDLLGKRNLKASENKESAHSNHLSGCPDS